MVKKKKKTDVQTFRHNEKASFQTIKTTLKSVLLNRNEIDLTWTTCSRTLPSPTGKRHRSMHRQCLTLRPSYRWIPTRAPDSVERTRPWPFHHGHQRRRPRRDPDDWARQRPHDSLPSLYGALACQPLQSPDPGPHAQDPHSRGRVPTIDCPWRVSSK